MQNQYSFIGKVTRNGEVIRTYDFSLDKLLEKEPEVFGNVMASYFASLKKEIEKNYG